MGNNGKRHYQHWGTIRIDEVVSVGTDNGCQFADKCRTHCPFPKCYFEMTKQEQYFARQNIQQESK